MSQNGYVSPSRRPPSREDAAEAASALRRLLAAVESGEIDADTPRARVLLRRLEGVLAAWEVEGGKGTMS
jgi:transcription elongation GreA/GreB family factor